MIKLKRHIVLTAVGPLFAAVALLLSGCSKDKSEPPMQDGVLPRPCCIHIENRSSFQNVTFHFHDDESHCDNYAARFGGRWREIKENEFIPLRITDYDTREPNAPNAKLNASSNYEWYGHVIISIDRDDQQKFQIKATAAANNSNEVWVFPVWTNGGKRVKITTTHSVGYGNWHDWSVFVNIYIDNL